MPRRPDPAPGSVAFYQECSDAAKLPDAGLALQRTGKSLLTSSAYMITGTAKASGRVVAHAAAVPAFAAAGMIWELKDQLHHDKDHKTAVSSLIMQPSVLNWHDMPASAH